MVAEFFDRDFDKFWHFISQLSKPPGSGKLRKAKELNGVIYDPFFAGSGLKVPLSPEDAAKVSETEGQDSPKYDPAFPGMRVKLTPRANQGTSAA